MRAFRGATLVLLLALLVTGCGGSGNSSSGSGGTKSSAQASTVGKGPLRVGLVTDIGQLNDHGFNQLAYEGLLRAEKVLGVKGRVYQSASAADYVPNLSAFARQGYDLVISVGFDQAAAIAKAAAAYPKTHFAIVDVSNADLTGKPANVRGLIFKEQEAGYLAGTAAALQLAGTPGPHVIGSVGGEKQPPVDRYIAGYQAGAKAADPAVKLLNGYSQDWVDQAKCKELALQQIASSAKVVFAVAGGCGLGVLDAAKEQKVWAIGVDADQGYLGKQVLTSALKKVDQAVFLTIQDVQDGTFKGGEDSVFGLDRDGVGVGRFSSLAKPGLAAAVAKVRRQIVSGVVKDIPTTVP
jgi:basic membrane protein A and related proteins